MNYRGNPTESRALCQSAEIVKALNDTEFDVAADGSYELIASAEPQPRNWLRLEPGAGSIGIRLPQCLT